MRPPLKPRISLRPLRRLAAFGIVVAAIAGRLAGLLPQGWVLAAVGGVLLAHNELLCGRTATAEGACRRRHGLAEAAGDLAVLTALVFWWGGVESPAVVFYFVPALWAGALIGAPTAYWIAAAGTALVAAVGSLQAVVPGLYQPIAAGLSGLYFGRWPLVALEVAALGAASFLAARMGVAARNREAVRRLTRDRELLASVLCGLDEGVALLAPDGQVQLWNPALDDWFGKQGTDGTPQRVPPELQRFARRAAAVDGPLEAERFLVTGPAGSDEEAQRFRTALSPIFGQRKQHLGYAMAAMDVTEQLKFEEDLRRRNRERNREILAMSEALQRNQREMNQHEKMVAIGTMAAGIAHEIGNPLASLSAVVQLLRRGKHSEKDLQRLNTLEEQIERIAKIVRQMLEFSRPAATDWTEANLDELIEQTVTMVSYSHRARSVQIESVRNPDLPVVRTMPQLFQQVLVNLLLNAMDAVGEQDGRGRVTVRRTAEGEVVRVSVADAGVGMDEEQIRHAFEPFYTTKAPGHGTGLGLAVSYRLVERLGGDIHIESAPGEGTTVTLSFKAEPTEARLVQDEAESGSARP